MGAPWEFLLWFFVLMAGISVFAVGIPWAICWWIERPLRGEDDWSDFDDEDDEL